MAGRGKFFELLDLPKFGIPSVLRMEAVPTSFNVTERLAGKSFMSYGQVWPRLGLVVRGLATESYIVSEIDAYSDDWKNQTIRDVLRLLNEQFGGKGTWYPQPTKPLYVLGFWFKPSIKGIWFFKNQAYAVLINARKGQPLSAEDIRFLGRGVYDLHCIDDPNDPIPLIVDLSEHEEGKGRKLKVHVVPVGQAASLEAFDQAVREFLLALNLAGVSLPVPISTESVVDLFKKK